MGERVVPPSALFGDDLFALSLFGGLELPHVILVCLYEAFMVGELKGRGLVTLSSYAIDGG